MSGKEHEILKESPDRQLSRCFSLIKKLFEGVCKIISLTQPLPAGMKRITDIMEPLSVVAEWAKIGKQSACRLGAMRALALSKAYQPGLKSELLAGGFPEIKADGTPFT